MNKFVFLLPLMGLCVSLLIIGHDRSKADSLKQSVSRTTTGTGYICNEETCNNGNGCVDFGSSRITWFPKFKCTYFFSTVYVPIPQMERAGIKTRILLSSARLG